MVLQTLIYSSMCYVCIINYWLCLLILCCCRAVEDLLKYLDPQFTDHITLPDAMKLEFILAGKNQEGPGGTKQMSV